MQRRTSGGQRPEVAGETGGRRVGVAEGLQHLQLRCVQPYLDARGGGNVQRFRLNQIMTDALG